MTRDVWGAVNMTGVANCPISSPGIWRGKMLDIGGKRVCILSFCVVVSKEAWVSGRAITLQLNVECPTVEVEAVYRGDPLIKGQAPVMG